MVGSTGVMTMRLIRSKIRKREDSSVVDTVNVETPLPHQRHTNHHHHHNSSNQQYHQNLQQQYQNGQQQQQQINNNNNTNQANNNNSGVWVFPPLPPQPNIYSVNHLALMQANNDHKNGFKGLKRQLSGRFKRMISRKPNEPPTPTIPPELKPQLKTIYVY